MQFSRTTVVTAAWLSSTVVPLVEAYPDIHVSLEGDTPIGTAPGLMQALTHAGWDGSEDVFLTTGDTIYLGDLAKFTASWDQESIRLLVVPSLDARDFAPTWRFTGTAIIPGAMLKPYTPSDRDIVADLFRPHYEAGSAELFFGEGTFFDCGTPVEYWMATMVLGRGRTLVEDARLAGANATRSILLAGVQLVGDEPIRDSLVSPSGRFVFEGLVDANNGPGRQPIRSRWVDAR